MIEIDPKQKRTINLYNPKGDLAKGLDIDTCLQESSKHQ